MVSLKSVINLNLKSSLTLLGLLSAFAAFSLGGCQAGTEGQSVRKERQRQYSEVNHSALLRKYLRDMQEHIKKQWRPLEEDFLKGGVVFFVVNKDGTISDLHVTKSTGSETADERMLTAVAHSVPLPVLPEALTDNLPVKFSFNLRVLGSTSVFDDQDELKRLIAKYTKEIEEDANDRDSLKRRAQAWMAMAPVDDMAARAATRDLTRLIELGERTAETYQDRALAHKFAGEKENFLKDAQLAVSFDPSNVESRIIFIEAQEANGLKEEALNQANEAIVLAPNYSDVWAARSYTKLLKEDYNGALEDANQALVLEPESAQALAYRGDAREGLKQYDKAIVDYGKSIRINPDDWNTYLRRARLFNQLDKYDRAVLDATAAIELNPSCGEAYYYRSYANKALDITSQSEKDMAKAKHYGFTGK